MIAGRVWKTDELKEIPHSRLDWTGSGALLELFHRTTGKERAALVQAIGQVIAKHSASAATIAQLIHIASSLDLAEVEPQVRQLQSDPFGAEKPVKGAIANYLAFRKLKVSPEAKVPVVTANGEAVPRKAKQRK